MDLHPYRDFMLDLARQSGAFIRPFFGRADLKIEYKADLSPVTAADRGAEELLRRLIQSRYPDHGVLGEELGEHRTDAEFVWVLDPIDGTKSFAAAIPLFGTLIALLHRGQPVLGCIHQPILGQILIGDGQTASLNGDPVRARAVRTVEEATILTSDPVNPARYRNGPAFGALIGRARLSRTWGDCYGYLMVATGRADAMLDPIMNPWDIAALIPIIRGAGGVITDWKGGDPVGADSIVAAGTPELHAAVVGALNPQGGVTDSRHPGVTQS